MDDFGIKIILQWINIEWHLTVIRLLAISLTISSTLPYRPSPYSAQ